jgi:hypothetical protein
VLERERSRLKAQASDEWAAGVELLARFGSNWPKALE